MAAQYLEPAAGIALCIALFGGGFALALWTIRRLPDPARMTFHWPRPDVLVVEVRSPASLEQLGVLREQLRQRLGHDVLVVVLEPGRL